MPGLLRGIARTAVVAGTATAVSNRVTRRQAGRWTRQSSAPPAADDDVDETLSQLRELSELKSQRALTEDEFQWQKRLILER
jgi:hypothetical protein